MSSSTDAVIRGEQAVAAHGVQHPDLRTGAWTRFGDDSVLGDVTTEQTLSTLAASARSAARAQGYLVGWAEGRREAADTAADTAAHEHRVGLLAEQRRAAEHEQAVAALLRAARELTDLADTVTRRIEDQALRLARELTETLVGHELRHAPDPAADLVARVLGVRPDDQPVTVRLPAGVIGTAAAESLQGGLAGARVRLVEDPSLGAHDAVVELDDRVIDLRADAALARVREVLA